MTFRYRILEDILTECDARSLLELALSEAGWKLHEEWFFSQYDIAWVRRTFGKPSVGAPTVGQQALLDYGRSFIEANFGAVLGKHYTIIGHKMVPGQLIGLHNDSPEGDRGRIENYRFIYYLDAEYSDDKGGHLFLFGSRSESDVVAAVRPNFNSGIVMELSDQSYHAVSKIKHGNRYCVVASYWGYPILHAADGVGETVRDCLNLLIERGLEDKAHSGTTFLNHLYNTYRLLSEWGCSDSACVAGLMHSVLGRQQSKVMPVGLSPDGLSSLIGERAFRLVELLRDGRFNRSPVETEIDNDLRLIETANALEQANSYEDLDEALSMIADWRVDASYASRIEAEVAKQRGLIERNGGRSGERTPHHDR